MKQKNEFELYSCFTANKNKCVVPECTQKCTTALVLTSEKPFTCGINKTISKYNYLSCCHNAVALSVSFVLVCTNWELLKLDLVSSARRLKITWDTIMGDSPVLAVHDLIAANCLLENAIYLVLLI